MDWQPAVSATKTFLKIEGRKGLSPRNFGGSEKMNVFNIVNKSFLKAQAQDKDITYVSTNGQLDIVQHKLAWVMFLKNYLVTFPLML